MGSVAVYVKAHAVDSPVEGRCCARVSGWRGPEQCRWRAKHQEGGLGWCGHHRPSRFGHGADPAKSGAKPGRQSQAGGGTSDRELLERCVALAKRSNDPRKRVGALLLGPDGSIRGEAWNRFPAGIAETPERLGDREAKNRLMVHAERGAILAAARAGRSTRGCTLYLAVLEDGAVSGGPPCSFCTNEVLEAGVRRIVSWAFKSGQSNWAASTAMARDLLAEAHVELLELAPDDHGAPTPVTPEETAMPGTAAGPAFKSFDPATLWNSLDEEQRQALGVAAIAHIAGAIGTSEGYAPLRAFDAADIEGFGALVRILRDVAPEWSANPVPPDLTALGVPQCRSCGCTDNVACDEGCCWVQPGLCSSCGNGPQAGRTLSATGI